MGAYRVPEHIWRTKDNRLVLTGDLDAAFLAYARGDEMSEEVARERGILDVVAGKSAVREVKAKPASSKVSGVTINRANKETTNG